MLVAVGDFDPEELFTAFCLMAEDKNIFHEHNQNKAPGDWRHEDGWGMAYIQERRWKIHKSILPAFSDAQARPALPAHSPVVLFHSRKRTKGDIHEKNTHPFAHGRYVFCHNGTIEGDIKHAPCFLPQGETDSERLFYAILSAFGDGHAGDESAFHIREVIQNYKKNTGSNIILSSPEKTFVSVNYSQYPAYYSMALGVGKEGIIISSEKVPVGGTKRGMEWSFLNDGEIAVIEHGNRKVKVLAAREMKVMA